MTKNIKVKFSRTHPESYDIVIGITQDDIASNILKKFPNSKIFVITDSNVLNLYARKFSRNLKNLGAEVHLMSFKAGEESKTRKTKEQLENQILAIGAKRDSIIIAFGGGVVGDIAGFIAATLNRGVPYIQIPTTLLSQIDSSVGGKVAVNHPTGKNLIGSFYQPKAVYIDIETLKTLSDEDFRSGISEAIKYGAILDSKLFDFISTNREKILMKDITTLAQIIYRCCRLKSEVVAKDEKEKSYRRILNFGHTVGHAIEQLSGYKISHGQAIAIGMVAETKFSVFLKMIDIHSLNRLILVLSYFDLPTNFYKKFSVDKIIKSMQADKKSGDGFINFTLLEAIGKAVPNVPLENGEIRTMLRLI